MKRFLLFIQSSTFFYVVVFVCILIFMCICSHKETVSYAPCKRCGFVGAPQYKSDTNTRTYYYKYCEKCLNHWKDSINEVSK